VCERERGKKRERQRGRKGGGPILIFSSFPTGFSCVEKMRPCEEDTFTMPAA